MPSKRSHRKKSKSSRNAKKISKPEGDVERARAFDEVVRDLPTRLVSTGRANTTRARAGDTGFTEPSQIIQQLYTARKLAEDTRNEIDKRITELRRQLRRSAAA